MEELVRCLLPASWKPQYLKSISVSLPQEVASSSSSSSARVTVTRHVRDGDAGSASGGGGGKAEGGGGAGDIARVRSSHILLQEGGGKGEWCRWRKVVEKEDATG